MKGLKFSPKQRQVLTETGTVDTCYGEIGVVAAVIVIVELKTDIGAAQTVIIT